MNCYQRGRAEALNCHAGTLQVELIRHRRGQRIALVANCHLEITDCLNQFSILQFFECSVPKGYYPGPVSSMKGRLQIIAIQVILEACALTPRVDEVAKAVGLKRSLVRVSSGNGNFTYAKGLE